jgi:hypothetical protein
VLRYLLSSVLAYLVLRRLRGHVRLALVLGWSFVVFKGFKCFGSYFGACLLGASSTSRACTACFGTSLELRRLQGLYVLRYSLTCFEAYLVLRQL